MDRQNMLNRELADVSVAKEYCSSNRVLGGLNTLVKRLEISHNGRLFRG